MAKRLIEIVQEVAPRYIPEAQISPAVAVAGNDRRCHAELRGTLDELLLRDERALAPEPHAQSFVEPRVTSRCTVGVPQRCVLRENGMHELVPYELAGIELLLSNLWCDVDDVPRRKRHARHRRPANPRYESMEIAPVLADDDGNA